MKIPFLRDHTHTRTSDLLYGLELLHEGQAGVFWQNKIKSFSLKVSQMSRYDYLNDAKYWLLNEIKQSTEGLDH